MDKQCEAALQRLVRLGDMMGDGLHLEPDGAWITMEYRKAMIEARLLKPSQKDTAAIDAYMEKRVKEELCSCGGGLKQTRKGSLRAKCIICGITYQLGKRRKGAREDG